MAEIKQIKIGNTTYNIEPYTSYLPTSGGKLTGLLTLMSGTGGYGLKFRDHASYQVGMYYGTGGDEALTLAMQNKYTAFQIINEKDPSTLTDSSWQTLKPGFQVKGNKVAINKTIGEDAFPSYDLDVGGTICGTTIYENEIPLSNKYAAKSYVDNSIAAIIDSESTYKTFKKVAEYIAEDKTGAADMMSRIKANATAIANEKTRAEGVEGGLADDISAINKVVNAHETSIKTNQTNIKTNQTNISTNKTNISTNKTNISTNQTNISTLQGYFTNGKANGLNGLTAAVSKLNYTANVTSDIQQQLNSKISSGAPSIEINSSGSLKGFGGHIDFHYYTSGGVPHGTNGQATADGKTPDYSSRIIEIAGGTLQVNGTLLKWGGYIEGALTGNVTGNLTGNWSGGNVTNGHVYLTGSNAGSSVGNTTQLVFGTSKTNHVALTSNDKALVINPTTGSTTNQIVLYLNSESVFPSGLQSKGKSVLNTDNVSGTANRVPKFTAANKIGNSGVVEDGTQLYPASDVGRNLGERNYRWSDAHIKALHISREKGVGSGYISFYSPTYSTWHEYMSDTSQNNPSGVKPKALGDVTSWARRSLIENESGFGWIWEAAKEKSKNSNVVSVPEPVMALSSYSGKLTVKGDIATSTGLITQGSPSSDSTVTSMNRFAADLFVSGNGSAPNNPKVAGFYLGKSASDENRHMDIVSGADYSYIDFNKASVVNDYQARLLVNVTTGHTEWCWNAGTKTFAFTGGTVSASQFSAPTVSATTVTATNVNSTNSTYTNLTTTNATCTNLTASAPIKFTTETSSKRIIYGSTRNSGMKYDYGGNEALIISAGTYDQSSIHFYSSNRLAMNDSSNQWSGTTPCMAIKNKCVAINGLFSGTPTHNLHVTGTAYFTSSITASSVYATSDERLKENITTAELNYYDFVNNIHLVNYTWKDDENHSLQHGVIAQELQNIIPDELKDHFILTDKGCDDMLAVNDGKLVYIALGALQQQAKINAQLEERISKLEKLLGV